MICPTCGTENTAQATRCASCGTPLPTNIQTGHTGADSSNAPITYSPHLEKGVRLQGGNYAVGEVLGQGGFGITYKGGDLSLRRYVAIKEFFPQGCARQGNTVVPSATLSAADYAGVKNKFIEEARTLAKFSDPGIVRVFGVFEENNTAYMVMEFLEGQTLSARITEKGKLEESEVINVAEKIGGALATVHQTGLIHRDIKPDNICLTNEGRIVLIDFGTARAFASNKTIRQTTLLTPGYAPLEQYGQQARFGPYTDIYALSATLYHALTGTLPAPAPDRASGVDLKAPQWINRSISPNVSNAIMRGMSIAAAERPQDVKEFVASLTAQNVTPVTPPAPPQVVTPQSPPSPGPGWGAAPGQGMPASPNSTTPQSESEEKWYHAIGSRETGPMSRDTMQGLVRNGIIKPHTMIWREGMGVWIAANQSEWASQLGTAPVSSEPDLQIGIKETGFDRFMMSIPGFVWTLMWIGIFLFISGRIALGVIRYQNGSRDFGPTLAQEVMKTPEAAPLREATLQLGEPTFDTAIIQNRYDSYIGKVRYQDGDAGDINLTVTSRDWWWAPEKFQFNFSPTNFGPVMAGQIQQDMQRRLRIGGTDLKVRGPYLNRISRTQYSGNFSLFSDSSGKEVENGSITVIVSSFGNDGAPTNWTFIIR